MILLCAGKVNLVMLLVYLKKMKFPKKYSNVIMATLMALFMGGCMSGIVTYINIGFVDNFMYRWGSAFAIVFPLALTLTLLFTPLAVKLTSHITK